MKPRTCYHCRRNAAMHNSVFCAECSHNAHWPLFFPTERKRGRAATGLLYTGAAAAAVWLIYKTVEYVLTN